MGDEVKAAIREEALGLGFDAVGFAPAALAPEARANLAEFIARGFHGEMGWLAARAEQRGHPQALWPEAKSVVVLGLNYGPTEDPLAPLARKAEGGISVYARGRDYHDIVKSRLKALARAITARWPGELKVFVDTAPVMEKPLAARAGIGWQGKHTNLVSRQWGSWLFLGEIYLSLALAPDAAESDHCGECARCLEVCPTRAFPAPYRLDARRCISYLTIEHKSAIPEELRAAIGNRIYGCDDCQLVCPWNKFSRAAAHPDFKVRHALDAPALPELFSWTAGEFEQRMRGSAIHRLGFERWSRNIAVALGNAPTSAAVVSALEARRADASPLVREHVAWALKRHQVRDAPPARCR